MGFRWEKSALSTQSAWSSCFATSFPLSTYSHVAMPPSSSWNPLQPLCFNDSEPSKYDLGPGSCTCCQIDEQPMHHGML